MGQSATDFLTPSSSFIIGVGSAFCLSGNYFEFNRSRTPAEADMRALRSDWKIVGEDIAQALVRERIKRLANADAP